MTTPVELFQAAWNGLSAELPHIPAVRSAAIGGLSFPDRRNEAWRFSSARKLLAEPSAPVVGAVTELPDNVLSLAGLQEHPALDHLGRVAGTEGFLGLNAAFFREGALVFVPADDTESVTLELSGLEGTTTPRILVVVEEEGELELLVENVLGGGLHVPVVEVVAGPSSKVSISHVVRGEGSCVAHLAVQLGEGSEVAIQSVVTGGERVRVELVSSGASNSTLNTSGLVLARDRQHVDHHLELVHSSPDMVSSQVFRNILDDRARAVFTGQVTVPKNVTGSDATQSANTLLLADGASAVARPWLEIHNEDVVASHGATVGRLDDDALFYLQARGISALEARKLLTSAFAGEIVETLPEAFRPAVEGVVTAWLDR